MVDGQAARKMHPVLGQAIERMTELEASADLPSVLLADPDHLERILLDFIGNALKCSDRGTEVRLSLARVSDEMSVQVADQGWGIRQG